MCRCEQCLRCDGHGMWRTLFGERGLGVRDGLKAVVFRGHNHLLINALHKRIQADTGISFSWGAFPFHQLDCFENCPNCNFLQRIYKNRWDSAPLYIIYTPVLAPASTQIFVGWNWMLSKWTLLMDQVNGEYIIFP